MRSRELYIFIGKSLFQDNFISAFESLCMSKSNGVVNPSEPH